jgi:hypothetical protein
MNWEGIWEEAVATHLKYWSDTFLEGLRRTTKTRVWTANILLGIESEHLPNTHI